MVGFTRSWTKRRLTAGPGRGKVERLEANSVQSRYSCSMGASWRHRPLRSLSHAPFRNPRKKALTGVAHAGLYHLRACGLPRRPDYRIRALSDLQQLADPHHFAERIGISSALWSLFGQVWPSGKVIAEAMSTASDHHPLAELVLRHNATQNKMLGIVYRDLYGEVPDLTLGLFDLIIGSDVLYESGHADQLAATILRHAMPDTEILITDPGRGNSTFFTRALAIQGFAVIEQRGRFNKDDVPPFRGRLLNYRRGHSADGKIAL
jgi:hypothetical protein